MGDKTITTITPGSHRLLRISEEVALQLEPLLDQVPEAAGDDDRILRAILAAEDPDAVDSAWRGHGLRDLVEQRIVVHGIRWAPSDFAEGIGVFLICDVTLADGERTVTTTGSASCVMQLVKWHTMGAFPLEVIPKEAQSKKDPGRKPMHLELSR